MMRATMGWRSLAVAALVLAACDEAKPAAESDTEADTTPDTAEDTAEDTTLDTGADTTPDTASDASPDTEADTTADTEADTTLPPRCGDGLTQPELGDEGCDDANTVSSDGCNDVCVVEFCGDATVQTGERCDDGNATSGDGCSALCIGELCGDGTVQTILGEACDNGAANSDTLANACRTSCLTAGGRATCWRSATTATRRATMAARPPASASAAETA